MDLAIYLVTTHSCSLCSVFILSCFACTALSTQQITQSITDHISAGYTLPYTTLPRGYPSTAQFTVEFSRGELGRLRKSGGQATTITWPSFPNVPFHLPRGPSIHPSIPVSPWDFFFLFLFARVDTVGQARNFGPGRVEHLAPGYATQTLNTTIGNQGARARPPPIAHLLTQVPGNSENSASNPQKMRSVVDL
ncbi:hypothetical protein B0T13DRAFT_482848 [Neurospora crassa]|nr:hypothetical protein B0T13DRAFT_482848 [Neurospora crassa]